MLEVADRILAPEEPETSELLTPGVPRRGDPGRDRASRSSGSTTTSGAAYRVTTDRGELRRRPAAGGGRPLGRTSPGSVSRPSASTPRRGRVETDERLRAGERLWAVGDITGHGAFTHVSMYQGAIAVRDILGQDGFTADYRAVSRVTFTDPEVGAVGMTEAQARDAGIEVRVGQRRPRGVEPWLDPRRRQRRAAQARRRRRARRPGGGDSVGPNGGEVLGLLALAVHAEVPLERIASMHFAYPTFHRAVDVAVSCPRRAEPSDSYRRLVLEGLRGAPGR